MSAKKEKITRVVFAVLSFMAVVFQFFHGAGFVFAWEFTRSYGIAMLIFCIPLTAGGILGLCKKYFVSLVFTAIGAIAFPCIGYMLANPNTNTTDYYITGVTMGVFWTRFAPTALLLVPVLLLVVWEIRRRQEAYEAMSYEKQFK